MRVSLAARAGLEPSRGPGSSAPDRARRAARARSGARAGAGAGRSGRARRARGRHRASRSRSIVRGPQRRSRTRPSSRSTASRASRSSRGPRSVSTQRGAVEEAGLVEDADGIGLAERGDRDEADALAAREQPHRLGRSCLAVAEVRAEPDVGLRHARRCSTETTAALDGRVEPHVRLVDAHADRRDRETREQRVRDRGGERLEEVVGARVRDLAHRGRDVAVVDGVLDPVGSRGLLADARARRRRGSAGPRGARRRGRRGSRAPRSRGARSSRRRDRRRDRERLDVLADVVDAEDRGAALEGGDGCAHGGRRCSGRRGLIAEQLARACSCARAPTRTGPAERGEHVEPPQRARGSAPGSCRSRSRGRGRSAPPGSRPRRRTRAAPRGRPRPRRPRRRSAGRPASSAASPCMCIRHR